MARDIDLTKPLSPEDLDYLTVREKWHFIAQADGLNDATEAQQRHERSLLDQEFAQVSSPPTRFPAAPAGDPGVPDSLEPPVVPYEDMSVADLKQELKERKADALAEDLVTEEQAATRFSLDGNKQALVDRLYADDRLAAEEGQ